MGSAPVIHNRLRRGTSVKEGTRGAVKYEYIHMRDYLLREAINLHPSLVQ